MAAQAISRRREQTVVYLRPGPAGRLVAAITGSLSSHVPSGLSGRRTSVVAGGARARDDARVIELGATK